LAAFESDVAGSTSVQVADADGEWCAPSFASSSSSSSSTAAAAAGNTAANVAVDGVHDDNTAGLFVTFVCKCLCFAGVVVVVVVVLR
jgi:hypothetical protein